MAQTSVSSVWVSRYWRKGQNINTQQHISDETIDAHNIDGPWAPHSGVKVVTWSDRFVFPSRAPRANTKFKGLERLLKDHEIIMLQETHLAHKSIRILKSRAVRLFRMFYFWCQGFSGSWWGPDDG